MFTLACVFTVLALFGVFDGPAARVSSAASMCASARSINLFPDAETYCGRAKELLAREKSLPLDVVADAHTEIAALAITRKRVEEAVHHCELALVAWRSMPTGKAYPGGRLEKTTACETLIAAARAARQK